MPKKRLRTGKGLERATIVERVPGERLSHAEYIKRLEEDFDKNRIAYDQVEFNGVLVYVKVQQK